VHILPASFQTSRQPLGWHVGCVLFRWYLVKHVLPDSPDTPSSARGLKWTFTCFTMRLQLILALSGTLCCQLDINLEPDLLFQSLHEQQLSTPKRRTSFGGNTWLPFRPGCCWCGQPITGVTDPPILGRPIGCWAGSQVTMGGPGLAANEAGQRDDDHLPQVITVILS